MQLLKCTSGIRKSKPLLPKMILSRFVTAGRSVGVASLASIKQLIPAERQAATPVRAAWGAPSRAGTDPSGARRIRPDFSHVHCKAGSRLFSRAKHDDRPRLPKEEEGEKYKHAWAERPARAAGVEASCWDGRCGGARRCSLPLSTPPCPWWLLSHTSQMPSWQRRQRQKRQSCQPGFPALWQRQRRQRDVRSFPPAAEWLLTLALYRPGLGLTTVNMVF